MNRFYYDFHIHSCLSPCAEDDMTPNNIAGMALLAGLQIVALTDHNSCKNGLAFAQAARRNGLIPICGMELTTAEDIHVVCLFPSPQAAADFDSFVDARRMHVPNNERIFGSQLILDENDELVGKLADYLPAATSLMIGEVPEAVARFGGVCYPAHVDREANGAIAVLGDFPPEPGFLNAELADAEKIASYRERYPALQSKRILVSSDAHNLWSIRDKSAFLELDAEPSDEDGVVKALFDLLGRAV